MAKRILVNVAAVFVGIVVGMVFMIFLHMASTIVYPMPEDVDMMDQSPENLEKLHAWFATLPTGAFLLATLCHALGCMSAAIVAMLISGRRTIVPAMVVGVFFTIGGIMNLSSVPHPSWFPMVDLPVYLIFAGIAGLLLKRDVAGETKDSGDE